MERRPWPPEQGEYLGGLQVTEALSVSTGAVNYMSVCNYQS